MTFTIPYQFVGFFLGIIIGTVGTILVLIAIYRAQKAHEARLAQQQNRDLPKALGSICDQWMFCPECRWIGKVIDCEPDVDGDGNLGCPRCNTVTVMIDEKGQTS